MSVANWFERLRAKVARAGARAPLERLVSRTASEARGATSISEERSGNKTEEALNSSLAGGPLGSGPESAERTYKCPHGIVMGQRTRNRVWVSIPPCCVGALRASGPANASGEGRQPAPERHG